MAVRTCAPVHQWCCAPHRNVFRGREARPRRRRGAAQQHFWVWQMMDRALQRLAPAELPSAMRQSMRVGTTPTSNVRPDVVVGEQQG
jgi:hypothetical protein